MNSRNLLERSLASWAPRRPSDRVERSLFGDREPDVVRCRSHVFPWLAPATAFLMVAFVAHREMPDVLSDHGVLNLTNRDARVLRSEVLTAAARDSQSHVNRFAGRRFEWTSPAGFPSSTPSFMQLGTNSLKR